MNDKRNIQTNDDSNIVNDIKELREVVEVFTENIITQMSLLRNILTEVMIESGKQAASGINRQEFQESLNAFNLTVQKIDYDLKDIKKTVGLLEEKVIDKNNESSINTLICSLKKNCEEVNETLLSISKDAFNKDEKEDLREILETINKKLNDMANTKKSLSFWLDWIYKLGLTVVLVWTFVQDKIIR